MTHDKIFILVAQMPTLISLFYVVFVDFGNEKRPFIAGWRRRAGWAVYFALFFTWLAAMFGTFSQYFGVPDGLGWGYFGAAVLVRAVLYRSQKAEGGESRQLLEPDAGENREASKNEHRG